MNKSKRIISLLLILIMIFGYVTPIMSFSDSSFKVRKDITRGDYEYRLSDHRVSEFSVSGYDAAYCLGFNSTFKNDSYTYNNAYNMKTEADSIHDKKSDWGVNWISDTKKKVSLKRSYEKSNGAKEYTRPVLTVYEDGVDVTYSDYNAVLWILDHMYVVTDDSTANKSYRRQFLEEVFADAIENDNFKVSSVKLTNNDIEVAQQWALWYFTNSSNSTTHVTKLPTVKMTKNKGQTNEVTKTLDQWGLTGRKQKYMNAIYIYLIENAMLNASMYGYENKRNPTINYPTTLHLCTIKGKYSTQQPIVRIRRTIPEKTQYSVIVRKYDQKGDLIKSEMKLEVQEQISNDESDGGFVLSSTSTQTINKGTATISKCDINDIIEDDIITIKEVKAPDGYEALKGSIKLNISKKVINGMYSVNKATITYGSSKDKGRVKVHVNKVNGLVSSDEKLNAVYVDIYDEELEAGFDLNIQKVDADTKQLINAQAYFQIVNWTGDVSGKIDATTKNGIADFGSQTIMEMADKTGGTYKCYIEESMAPVGYQHLDSNTLIELSVNVKLKSDNTGYIVESASVQLVDRDKNPLESQPDDLQVEVKNNKEITLTVPNEKVSGKYQMDLVKVDANDVNSELSEAAFDVNCIHYDDSSEKNIVSTDSIGTIDTNTIIEQDITYAGIDEYTITETATPTGYMGLGKSVKVFVSKILIGDQYIIDNVWTDSEDVVSIEMTSDVGITIKIKNTKLEGSYQLQIQKVDENGNNIPGASFVVYDSDRKLRASFAFTEESLNPVPLGEHQIYETGIDKWIIVETGAPTGYEKLQKEIHVSVEKVLDEENNKFDISEEIDIKDEDGVDIKDSDFLSYEIDNTNNIIKLIVKNKKIEGNYKIYYAKQDHSTGQIVHSSDITFNVTRNDEEPEAMTLGNGIRIVGPYQIESNEQTDTYVIEEVKEPNGYIKLKEPIEFKVHTKEVDGKYITDSVETESEYIETYVAPLTGTVFISINNDKIEGSYKLEVLKVDAESKEQLDGAVFEVKYPGETEYQELVYAEDDDNVTLPIDITKEGTDVLYVREKEAPQGYEKLIDELKVEITTEKKDEAYVVTDAKVSNVDDSDAPEGTEIHLVNDSRIELEVPNKEKPGAYSLELIKYDEDNTKLEDAEFTVTMPNGESKILLTDKEGRANIGEIEITKEGVDEFTIKETKAPEGYLGLTDEFKLKVETVKTSNGYSRGDVELIKNDQNVEYITRGSQIQIGVTNKELTDYDLTLRKFITSVNGNAPEVSREPVVDTSKLLDGSSTTATYTHTKDPLLVANTDTVVYTLRMYNEGISSTYAAEIKDDIPIGLEFIADNEINTKYGWKMYDKAGNETTDVTEAKMIKTDYLSKEQSEARGEDNLLKAFEYKEGAELDYRDIQVAFKVVGEGILSDRIIINTAEITNETDEKGNQVTDRDSTPDNNKEKEDDIDKEYLKLKYFDLSLLKWVSSTIVTENGKSTETLTGHTGLEDPEPVVKVELNRKKLDEVTVKFAYTIKVTNEGELEGYVKEISDYIPEGLTFVAEDNPEWSEEDGKIVTRQLENTLLNPGESANVTVILTWENGEDNLALKTNVAEISEDFNEYGEEDIDSTPDNQVEGEDDIDDAPVLLSISTGKAKMYIALTAIIMIALAGGIILIKKFVI
ncbi:MAG: Cys-Gln thioester bond-forming surface protein [Clostridia bacterium]|nr:Cys-Gln thioester bond-forming surface protein [Clostridia bacterium]